MKFDDLALGLLALLGGVAIHVSALGFEPLPGQIYGAGTMPRAIALVSGGLGLFLIGRSVAAGVRRPGVALADWTGSRAAVAGLALALGLVVLYVLLAGTVGFVPIAVAVMAALMLALGVRPLTAIAVSIAAALVIQQAFGRLLLVPLPRSPALPFLW